jgi:thiol-disulfide isomerase/thioredoxin
MKKRAYIKCILVIVFIILFQSSFCYCAWHGDQVSTAGFTLPAPGSAQEQAYLGLNSMESFKIPNIKADFVVVEFMSVYCPHCLASAPTMNRIYRTIQGDSSLSDIKMIAIAISNEKNEVQAYRKKFNIQFPILLDENAAISASMGGLATPTTMIVSTDGAKVLYSHTGVIQDPDAFIKQLKSLHRKRPARNERQPS